MGNRFPGKSSLADCFLPVGGFLTGLLYHYFGKDVEAGNNLLENIQEPKEIIPFKMAPFVYLGTMVTHFLEVLQVVKELLFKWRERFPIN
jgi:hypothetical protein